MLDFDRLTPYQKRTFVPNEADLTDLDQVTGLYQKLLERNIESSVDLEQWILDRSELEAVIDQQASVLYIRMTCQTDDSDRAARYKHFIETVSPVIKPLGDTMNKKYLQALERFDIDSQRHHVYTRGVKADVELFVKDNVGLQTKVDLLSQEYQTVCGAMTVEFDGKERTMPEMGKFLLEPDRDLRERAWRASSQRRMGDKDKLEDVFDQMLTLRHTIAQNAGCANFGEYKFRALHRFDYTPQDCKNYHDSVQKLLVPVWRTILQKRKRQMKLETLRPWDSSVDPLGRPALKPFDKTQELIDGCQNIFNKVDAFLGRQFTEMSDMGLLDLASRKGKAPGGYQSTLNEARQPFIFMNAVGVDSDVRTLLHEAGHAFHALACRDDAILDYRHGPMEFNEVASMSMELLAGEYISEFYNTDDARRSVTSHLEDIIYVLIWVAIIDAFQHWLYENPTHNRIQRREAWLVIQERFGTGEIDWSGLQEEHAYVWHRQLHIFEVPFYYIEYGIAQLGALQIWLNAKNDGPKAIKDYQNGLALGGSRTLPELFKAAGIRFDFSAETIQPLVEAVQKELS